MRSRKLHSRRLAGVAVAAAVMTVVAGCSTGPEGTPDTGSGGESAVSDAVSERAMEQLETLYGQGSMAEPPSEGPTAQSGKKVFLVNSGVQNPTGTKQVTAAQEAADELGWDLTIYDGKYDPAQYQEGIRQAVAQGADAIWLYSIDCPLAQTALDEAREAGIPVFSQEAADCSDVDPSADPYFAGSLQFSEGTFRDWAEGLGAAQAVWLLAQLGEQANVIEIAVPELVVTQAVSDGFQAKMEELCPSCPLTTVDVQIADYGPVMQEKIATALTRSPDANGIAFSFEDIATVGGSAAVVESGRSDTLEVVGGASFAANTDLIRDDAGQDGGNVFDLTFESWAAADMINRYFAGEEPVPTGVGIAVVDRDNGLPAPGEDWTTDIDYREAFKNVWGAS